MVIGQPFHIGGNFIIKLAALLALFHSHSVSQDGRSPPRLFSVHFHCLWPAKGPLGVTLKENCIGLLHFQHVFC